MKKQRTYLDYTHLYGRIWGAIAASLIVAYPFVCMIIFKTSIDWSIIASGLGIVAMYWIVSAIETFTYTPMLGSAGTYLGFVTGNLSNLKVPCALNCMQQADIKAGTEEGEVISTISTAISSIVTMIIIALGVVLVSAITPVLESKTLAPAFNSNNMLAALFGAMALVYISKNWKLAIIPATLMLVVFISASLLTGDSGFAGTLIGIMVPIGVIVSISSAKIMYNKGYLGAKGNITNKTEADSLNGENFTENEKGAK